jgi:hypothetical protein
MAVRDVLLSGDPRLRQPSRAVPPSRFGGEACWRWCKTRRDTMAARDGAGLAAPQIAETVLVNPEVTPLDSELEAGDEGCLSVLWLRAAVPRWFGRWKGSMPEWCSTNAITWRDSCSPIAWAEPQRQACHPFSSSALRSLRGAHRNDPRRRRSKGP